MELQWRADIPPLSSVWNVIIQPRETALSGRLSWQNIHSFVLTIHIGCKNALTVNGNTPHVYNMKLWRGETWLHSCSGKKKVIAKRVHVTLFLKCTMFPLHMFPHCYVFLIFEWINVSFDFWNVFSVTWKWQLHFFSQYITFIHLHFLYTQLVPHGVQQNLSVYHNWKSNSKVSKHPSWMYCIWKMF